MKTDKAVNTKHTPETYVEDGGECKPAYVHFADGATIEVQATAPTYDAMPLARLIAAAPELLAALTRLVEAFNPPADTTTPYWVEARAAIAKAEGGK